MKKTMISVVLLAMILSLLAGCGANAPGGESGAVGETGGSPDTAAVENGEDAAVVATSTRQEKARTVIRLWA